MGRGYAVPVLSKVFILIVPRLLGSHVKRKAFSKAVTTSTGCENCDIVLSSLQVYGSAGEFPGKVVYLYG